MGPEGNFFLKKKKKKCRWGIIFHIRSPSKWNCIFLYFMSGPVALAYILSSAAFLAPSCLGLTLVAAFLDDKCIYCNTCCCSS